ncbi:hypothetical protein pb186bvf_001887 [Paramecium bursaria]
MLIFKQKQIQWQNGENDSAIESLLKEDAKLELLYDNLNSFTDQQLIVLKLEFARQVDMQSEIDELKGLDTYVVDLKEEHLYEDQINDLRAEIQDIKNKIIDNDSQHRQQLMKRSIFIKEMLMLQNHFIINNWQILKGKTIILQEQYIISMNKYKCKQMKRINLEQIRLTSIRFKKGLTRKFRHRRTR